MRLIVGNTYFNKNDNYSVVIDRIYILSKHGHNLGQIKDTDEIDMSYIQHIKII